MTPSAKLETMRASENCSMGGVSIMIVSKACLSCFNSTGTRGEWNSSLISASLDEPAGKMNTRGISVGRMEASMGSV